MKKRSLLILPVTLLITSCNNLNNLLPTDTDTKYQLTINFDSTEGYVSGAINGLYLANTKISLVVTPNEGYSFGGIYEEDIVVSLTTNYEFNITKDTTLDVKFNKEINHYDFNLSYDESKGSVTGTSNGTYEENYLVSLDATPKTDYIFEGYYIDNNLITNNTHYEFNLLSDTNIEARFTLKPVEPLITYTFSISYDLSKGSVSGTTSGTYTSGTLISLNASANSGYKFSGYYDQYNNLLSSNTSYSFTLESDVSITVDFSSTTIVSHDYSYLYDNTIAPSRGSQGSIDSYYESCRGLKGEALKEELHEIIKDHKEFSYSSTNDSWYDSDKLNGQEYVFYEGTNSRTSLGSCNREHVWAKSHGNFGTSAPAGSDYHNLHPTTTSLNSTRGNYDFGEVDTSKSYKDMGEDYSWSTSAMKGNLLGSGLNTSSKVFEPKDEFKGDTARTIFYMAVRYDGEGGEPDLEVNGTIDTSRFYSFTSGASGLHGNFLDLYNWATSGLDPVSDFEVNRNNKIDSLYQHNRNPFIDHPEFIIMIYDKAYDGPGALLDY